MDPHDHIDASLLHIADQVRARSHPRGANSRSHEGNTWTWVPCAPHVRRQHEQMVPHGPAWPRMGTAVHLADGP